MKRKYSTYATQRRATRRAQDADDDAFYAEQARKRREAESQAAGAADPAVTDSQTGAATQDTKGGDK